MKKKEEFPTTFVSVPIMGEPENVSELLNKYGTYGENVGAYKNADSPYRTWYQWCDDGEEYHSWWGCRNLPNINELEPTYVDYILRDDSAIIKKWLRLGADGWRLDVADALLLHDLPQIVI